MKNIYVVHDLKADIYHSPFISLNTPDAVRALTDAVNDPQAGMISKYPADFELCYLGSYDDHSGKITPIDSPEHVTTALALVNKPIPLKQESK